MLVNHDRRERSKNAFERSCAVGVSLAINPQGLQLSEPEWGAAFAVDVAAEFQGSASTTGDDQWRVVVRSGRSGALQWK